VFSTGSGDKASSRRKITEVWRQRPYYAVPISNFYNLFFNKNEAFEVYLNLNFCFKTCILAMVGNKIKNSIGWTE